ERDRLLEIKLHTQYPSCKRYPDLPATRKLNNGEPSRYTWNQPHDCHRLIDRAHSLHHSLMKP
ncbi:uncharacterized protein METZ01_LOCUS477213, partial [marine metagenome]